jgi:hypothetical protein
MLCAPVELRVCLSVDQMAAAAAMVGEPIEVMRDPQCVAFAVATALMHNGFQAISDEAENWVRVAAGDAGCAGRLAAWRSVVSAAAGVLRPAAGDRVVTHDGRDVAWPEANEGSYARATAA